MILSLSFGTFIMKTTFLGLPLNELIILLLFLYSLPNILNKLSFNSDMIIILVWFAISAILILIGIKNYGIVAGRDGTGQIDILILLVLLSFPFKLITYESYQKFIIITLCLKIFDKLLPLFFGSTIELIGFGGTIGANIVVISSFVLGIIKLREKKIRSSFLLIIGSIFLTLLIQSRFLYISLIFLIFYFLFTGVLKFKKTLIYLCLLVFFINFSSSFLSSFSLVKASKFKLIPDSSLIVEHITTSFGKESNVFIGAADGYKIRFKWWRKIIEKANDDFIIMMSGQGFGVPLTDSMHLKIIREPHNSFFSVFGRGGIFYLIIWLFILYRIHKTLNFNLKSKTKQIFNVNLIAISVFYSTLIMGLVEPAFELPPVAVGCYFFIGLAFNFKNDEINSRKKFNN